MPENHIKVLLYVSDILLLKIISVSVIRNVKVIPNEECVPKHKLHVD